MNLAVLYNLTLVVWVGIEVWRQIREYRAGMTAVSASDRGSSVPLLLGLVGGVVVARIAQRSFALHLPSAPIPALYFWAGISLMWLGIALRLWSILVLGRFFNSMVVIHEGHAVVTRGPYRLLRHPSYAGAWMTCIGAGLALGNWLSLAAAVLLPLAGLVYRIRVEEEALNAALGDEYLEYSRHTWRLVPLVW
jgi:protein-S-isoprenylcysteine O-methyltransferase